MNRIEDIITKMQEFEPLDTITDENLRDVLVNTVAQTHPHMMARIYAESFHPENHSKEEVLAKFELLEEAREVAFGGKPRQPFGRQKRTPHRQQGRRYDDIEDCNGFRIRCSPNH